eukprot:1266309-Pleurochrysis_carterae.AAC.2
MHCTVILHAQRSTELPVIAGDTDQTIFKCLKPVPARAATSRKRYYSIPLDSRLRVLDVSNVECAAAFAFDDYRRCAIARTRDPRYRQQAFIFRFRLTAHANLHIFKQ